MIQWLRQVLMRKMFDAWMDEQQIEVFPNTDKWMQSYKYSLMKHGK